MTMEYASLFILFFSTMTFMAGFSASSSSDGMLLAATGDDDANKASGRQEEPHGGIAEPHKLSRRNAPRVDDSFEEIRERPTFVGHVENMTVRAGNGVKLTCQVKNLGNYKVAWVRVDTQTILTIHQHIITRNQRVSLSHHDKEIWRLHMENVEEADRGWYMCQINTDPMRAQRGFLDVVVPPSIIDSRTSSDVEVRENSSVNLTCEANGSPKPQLRWRRADGAMIRYKGGTVLSVEGNSLVIPTAKRVHIGTYYCIASNGVPPTKSKSIRLRVQFAPTVSIENQFELAYLGQNVSISCDVEAHPFAIQYWTFGNNTIHAGRRHNFTTETKGLRTSCTLYIYNVQKEDFGIYYCVAKSSLGEQNGAIKLSERILPSTIRPSPPPVLYEEAPYTLSPFRTPLTTPFERGISYVPYLKGKKSKRGRKRDKTHNQRANQDPVLIGANGTPAFASSSASHSKVPVVGTISTVGMGWFLIYVCSLYVVNFVK